MKSIAIWSGSSSSQKTTFKSGLQQLQEWFPKPFLYKEVSSYACKKESTHRNFLAGTDAERFESLKKILLHPEITDVFCSRGGYGSIRSVRQLDKLRLTPKRAKRFWGYSDLTVLQIYLYARYGWTWVHSPLLASKEFSSPSPKDLKIWKSVFTSPSGWIRKERLKLLNKGHSSSLSKAPLIGGNLVSLASLFGSDVLNKDFRPFYLFLEEIAEAPYKIDRLLQQLSSQKFFKKCKGVFLGHFTQCPQAFPILKLWAQEEKILLAKGLKAGHQNPNQPLLMGSTFDLRFQKNQTEILIELPPLKV